MPCGTPMHYAEAPSGFRDGFIAASLKLVGRGVAPRRRPRFRDGFIAASLKLSVHVSRRSEPLGFRDGFIAASLKHLPCEGRDVRDAEVSAMDSSRPH